MSEVTLLERLNVQGVYYASEKSYKLTVPQPSCNTCGALHGAGGTVVKNCNAVRRSLHLLDFELSHSAALVFCCWLLFA